MDLSKLRGGELIAAVAGIVLLITLLFLNWYSSPPIGVFATRGDLGAWDHQGFLGTLANLVILAAAVAGIGVAFLTATSRTVALPVATSALTAALGVGAVAMVLGRMVFQPGANESVDLKFGIWLALIGAAGVAIGGWQSMQEEGSTPARLRDRPTPTRPPPSPPPPSESAGPPGGSPPPAEPGERR